MIPWLNDAGGVLVPAAVRLFAQTTVLVALVLLVEWFGGRRLPASFRYALWLLIIVKLLLPPSLRLPTGVGYWLGRWMEFSPSGVSELVRSEVLHSPVGPWDGSDLGSERLDAGTGSVPPPRVNRDACLILVWSAGSLLFFGGLAFRSRELRRLLGRSQSPPPDVDARFRKSCESFGFRRPVLRVTDGSHSPAVSGLWRPTVLIPSALVRNLSAQSLDEILRHELVHLRRGDLWIQVLQTVVQGIWWWNPAAWLANGRIRALREQAVDEEVLLRGEGDAVSYSRTLLEVARFCGSDPTRALGILGVFGSRSDLRCRIERLLSGRLPRRAGLGRSGWAWLISLALLTLPMALGHRAEPDAFPPQNPTESPNGVPASGEDGTKLNGNAPAPSIYSMDPVLARRYGLSAQRRTNSTAGNPRNVQVYQMDPALAKRYGLSPQGTGQTGDTNKGSTPVYFMDPELARRYGLSQGGPANPKNGGDVGAGSGNNNVQVTNLIRLPDEGEGNVVSNVQGSVRAELKVPEVGDTFQLLGRSVEGAQLAATLARELPVADTNLLVVLNIEASRSTPWPQLVRAMNAANEAGITHLNVRMVSDRKAPSAQSMKGLADELVLLDSQLRSQWRKVDDLVSALKVPDGVVEGGGPFSATGSSDTRNLIQQRMDMGFRLATNQSLLRNLKAMVGSELWYAVNAHQPTPLLQTLLADLTIAEQQKAQLNPDPDSKLPEVERVNGVLGRIKAQIDTVVSGILSQIQTVVDADKEALVEVDRRIESARREDAATFAKYRPYLEERQKLDTILRMREALAAQIQQEAAARSADRVRSESPESSAKK